MTSLFRPRQYHRPTSLEGAVSLLAELGEKAIPIAGGTDLLVEKPSGIEYLIDLTRLPLVYIETIPETLDIRIGALTTVREIETSRLFKEEKYRIHDILSETARQQGYVTIRNLATIGGNICNAVPSADTAPALLTLEAKLKVIGQKGERIVNIEDFFTGPNETVLTDEELLQEIQVPNPPPHSRGRYLKLTPRKSMDLAIVGVAVVVLARDGIYDDIRIALGAVAPTPIRARRAENAARGQKLSNEVIERSAQIAAEECRPISDHRASAEYRSEMVKVLTKRAINQAIS